jgi:hypothetical protein
VIQVQTQVPTRRATQSSMRPDVHRDTLRETRGILDFRLPIDVWRTAELAVSGQRVARTRQWLDFGGGAGTIEGYEQDQTKSEVRV